MHHGVYEGVTAAAQRKRVLILGESHDGDDSELGKPGNLSTKDVVNDYLSQKDNFNFFPKIAPSFGIKTGMDEEKRLFWDKVFFGNYVNVVCRGGSNMARNLTKHNEETYNRELAEFVNLHRIDTIFCFSLLVFDHLPGDHDEGILPGENGEIIDGKKLGKNGHLEIAAYLCKWKRFDHPVRIYGMTHLSRVSPEPFVKYLKPAFEDCCG